MSKDPAVLWYTSDFLVGVIGMTDAQVGIYSRLLALQHQQGGYLTEKLIRLQMGGTLDPEIMEKFKQTPDGLYYNARMLSEIEKRRENSEKQRDNAYKRWNKKPMPPQCDGNAMAMPLEDIDVNENENSTQSSTGGMGGNEKPEASGSICYHDVDELLGELLASETWILTFCQMYNLTPDRVAEYIREFCAIRKTSDEMGKSLSEYRRHFSNWIRKEIKEAKRNNGKRSNKVTTLTDAVGRSLGIDER